MERNRRWTDFDIGIKKTGANLCKMFLLAKEGLLAFPRTRVAVEVALSPVHDATRKRCRPKWPGCMHEKGNQANTTMKFA